MHGHGTDEVHYGRHNEEAVLEVKNRSRTNVSDRSAQIFETSREPLQNSSPPPPLEEGNEASYMC